MKARFIAAFTLAATVAAGSAALSGSQPNFVVIFTDDQGYGDLSCFGGDHVTTPNIDRLAREGARLTSFYVAAPVCTPSRAALMTGCYPKRVNLATGSDFVVLLAGDPKGLNPSELTIAEVLKSAGYATGIFGKWHLGDQPEFLPTRQGFDVFFGIPYSHDIHPFHPNKERFNFPPLPLLYGETVLESDPDADQLTKRITDRAVEFIARNKDRPFFLYVPHPIPHRPLHVSEPFMEGVADEVKTLLAKEDGNIDYRNRDKLFRQAILEIDDSVGRIAKTLIEHDLQQNTLLIFTADNGPAVGSAGGLRGRKGSAYEGGMREPTVAWWPQTIPAGYECDQLMTTMDLLPTFAKLAGATLPDDRVIDGKDISELLTTPGSKTPHDRFFYHRGNVLHAVRSGPWKLYIGPQQGGPTAALYHLDNDRAESKNVAAAHPQVVDRLTGYIREFEAELGRGDDLTDRCRPAGFVDNAKPLVPHR